MSETVALIGLVTLDDAHSFGLRRAMVSVQAQTFPVNAHFIAAPSAPLSLLDPCLETGDLTIPPDSSLLKAANALIAELDDTYILFAPPTAELDSDSVEQLVEALQTSPAAAVAYCQDSRKSKWGYVIDSIPRAAPNALMTRFVNMFGPVLLVRRQALMALASPPLGIDSYRDGLHNLVVKLMTLLGPAGFAFVNKNLAKLYEDLQQPSFRSRASNYLSPFDIPTAEREFYRGSTVLEQADIPRLQQQLPRLPSLTTIIYGSHAEMLNQAYNAFADNDRFVGAEYILAGPNLPEVAKHSGSALRYVKGQQYEAMLQAQALAQGDYILFLDARTMPVSHGLERRLVSLLETLPDTVIMGSRVIGPEGRLISAGWELTDLGLQGLGAGRHWDYQGPRSILAVPHHCTSVNQGALLVRRDAVRAINPLASESWAVDMCLKARQAGFKVAYNPEAVVCWHDGAYPQPNAEWLNTTGLEQFAYYPAEVLFSGQVP